MSEKITIFWFRRDLRLEDNNGLYQALSGKFPVLPIFIFDPFILEELPKNDARVSFIYKTLQTVNEHLQQVHQTSIALFHKDPVQVFKQLADTYDVQGVYTNEDYEPYAIKRDTLVQKELDVRGIGFHSVQDQVIFSKNSIVKDNGEPYVVYTPYMKKWKDKFNSTNNLPVYDSNGLLHKLIKEQELPAVSLDDMGFVPSTVLVPHYDVSRSLISSYEATRNYPALEGTSHAGPHLRFGTVSIRSLIKKAIAEKNQTFWNELIWREFFMQILWHFPHTVNNAFKKKYDRITWRNNEDEFEKWKTGQTGYALVDAGMRELNATGYMHNRVRMLVASFLCKHLLIDWRWGEAYFAEKLLDYELSSNVGNWQWAAGSGVDAAPYFRIFNPMTQVDKFDAERNYIKKWVPEHDTDTYVSKIVDHKEARVRCLERYKEALA